MKYYATIYIDELFEEELLNFSGFTHTFLGLTKDKTPDELDKLDEEKRKEKLKNADWKDFDKRWYESLETNEFNDGFFGFAPVKTSPNHWGKVFEKNQSRKVT